jgi:hypothetical protein
MSYYGTVMNTSGLVAYWRLGEPSGTTVVDAFGTLDGTLTSGTLGTTGAIVGDSDTAYTFNGTTDVAIVLTHASIELTSGTLEFWFKTASAGAGFRGMVVKKSAWGVFLDDNVLKLYDWGGAAERVTAIDPTDDEWHHIALVFQSGVVNGTILYLDGVSVLTTTITVDSHIIDLTIAAGDTSPPEQRFAGSIDEVALYSSLLSPATVSYHYTAGSTASSEDDDFDNFVQLR